jgi:hypothetical protein
MKPGLCIAALAILLSACRLGAPKLTPDMDLDFGPWIPEIQPMSRLPDPEHRESIKPSELAEKLRVGDTARVTTTWQKTYVFRVYRVDDDSFAGLAQDDEKYKVPYENIKRVAVRRLKDGDELMLDFVMCSAGICK